MRFLCLRAPTSMPRVTSNGYAKTHLLLYMAWAWRTKSREVSWRQKNKKFIRQDSVYTVSGLSQPMEDSVLSRKKTRNMAQGDFYLATAQWTSSSFVNKFGAFVFLLIRDLQTTTHKTGTVFKSVSCHPPAIIVKDAKILHSQMENHLPLLLLSKWRYDWL